MDLELAALVLQEAVFRSTSTSPAWETPTSVSDNTPTVAWNFREAATINPVVVDLISIHSAHNRLHKIILSVFYNPGLLNTMANDAYRRFDLSPHPFLTLFH